MFGLGKHPTIQTDKLPIFVRTLHSNEAFQITQKLWHENGRLLRYDEPNNKEFLVFTYEKPACTVWLQRDKGRVDMMEIILVWNDQHNPSEVYTVAPEAGQGKVGNDDRALFVLQAMLTTPSIVPAK